MTKEEIIDFCEMKSQLEPENEDIFNYIIKALEQDSIALERYEDLCEYFGGSEAILKNRDEFKSWLDRMRWHVRKAEELYEKYEKQPKTGYISIDDVMSVFDDFMCGEDEEAETFLEMLKDKLAESEE